MMTMTIRNTKRVKGVLSGCRGNNKRKVEVVILPADGTLPVVNAEGGGTFYRRFFSGDLMIEEVVFCGQVCSPVIHGTVGQLVAALPAEIATLAPRMTEEQQVAMDVALERVAA